MVKLLSTTVLHKPGGFYVGGPLDVSPNRFKKAASQINGADAAYKALEQKMTGMRSEFKVLQDSVNHIDKNRIAPLEVMLETHKTNIDGLQKMMEDFVMPLMADVNNLQEEMAELKGEQGSNKRQKTSGMAPR